jgi:DnaJ-class molecular chaperone
MTVGDSAHRNCPICEGFGFMRRGSFADRRFITCTNCGGCGQIYLHPARPAADTFEQPTPKAA